MTSGEVLGSLAGGARPLPDELSICQISRGSVPRPCSFTDLPSRPLVHTSFFFFFSAPRGFAGLADCHARTFSAFCSVVCQTGLAPFLLFTSFMLSLLPQKATGLIFSRAPFKGWPRYLLVHAVHCLFAILPD